MQQRPLVPAFNLSSAKPDVLNVDPLIHMQVRLISKRFVPIILNAGQPSQGSQPVRSQGHEYGWEIYGPHSGAVLHDFAGAVAYDPEGNELSRFKMNICELPDAKRDPEIMARWAEHPEAWKASTENPIGPKEAMTPR